MKLFRRKREKGFTLIELLIVIAILGILAAGIVVAINPLEQLARARDAGRISAVTQLGKAMTAYVTNQNLAAYPTNVPTPTPGGTATGWQTNILIPPKEISTVITLPAMGSDCSAAQTQGNLCYAPLNSNTDATIWAAVESQAQKVRAACTGTNVAVIAWIASQQKTGLDCVASINTAPAATDILK